MKKKNNKNTIKQKHTKTVIPTSGHKAYEAILAQRLHEESTKFHEQLQDVLDHFRAFIPSYELDDQELAYWTAMMFLIDPTLGNVEQETLANIVVGRYCRWMGPHSVFSNPHDAMQQAINDVTQIHYSKVV